MQIEPEDVADLTTAIFAAALNPARWIDFLAQLHMVSGGVGVNMFGRDMSTGRLFGYIGVGYDDSFMVGYHEHFRHLNVWVDRFSSSPNGTYMPTAAMYPLEDLFRTEFYHDWVKPQEDMYGGGAIMLFNETDRFLAFGSHVRAKDRDRLEDSFEHLARMLTPHVQQAFEINRALEGKAISDFVAETSASSSTAVLLVRADGRLLFANPTAQAWIAQGTPVGVDGTGKLNAPDPSIASILEQALRSIGDLEQSSSAQLRTMSGSGEMEVILRIARFVPDRQQQSPFGILYSGDDRALLLTIEMKPVRGPDITTILQRHRLTPSEVEVALHLADGLPVSEIATRRGVSIYTIRNQRHAILSKLDLKTQSQLVRMLSTLDRAWDPPFS